MLAEIVVFLVTFVVAYFLYCYRRTYKLLREKDVKFIPGLPLYGNAYASMTNTKHIVDEIIEIYNAFPHERYVAYVEGHKPIILIRDPELVKAITVKNFDHFVDHKEFFPDGDIFGMSMFGMKAVPKDSQRIVGGSVTTIDSHPEIVALLYSGGTSSGHRQACGGSIINNRSILTAAECMSGSTPAMWVTRAGSTFAHSGGVIYNSAQIIDHPNYNPYTRENDIAMIRTSSNIVFTNVIRISNPPGDKWRDMRTTLSPAFTGSKMRLMLPSMMEVASNTVEYLKEHAGEEIDVDDIIRRYSNDVIASAGFGLQVNSLKDKDNEFFRIGQSIFKFNYYQYFVMFMYMLVPSLSRKLGMTLFSKKTSVFFREIVVSTMEYREKNNVERPDMIQLLMEASKGTLNAQPIKEDNVGFAAVEEVLKPKGQVRKWELDDLVAQVFLFFTAGFETTASTLVTCIHELALNEDVQQKLYEEVKNFNATSELTYESLGKLKYLDCVLNETLRRWSAALVLDRKCVKPYELPPAHEGGKPYQIRAGEDVYNAVNAIHLDSKYYPDPLKFIPERFSDENKHNIAPFTFMPFGMGPRNCIGSRLALMELKVLLFKLVLNFKILKSASTSTVLKLKTEGFIIKLDKGTFVKFEPRN